MFLKYKTLNGEDGAVCLFNILAIEPAKLMDKDPFTKLEVKSYIELKGKVRVNIIESSEDAQVLIARLEKIMGEFLSKYGDPANFCIED